MLYLGVRSAATKKKFAISIALLSFLILFVTAQKTAGSDNHPRIRLLQKYLSPDNSKLWTGMGFLNINTGELTSTKVFDNYTIGMFVEWTPDSKRIIFNGTPPDKDLPSKLYEYSISDNCLRRLGDKQYDTKLECVTDFAIDPTGLCIALGRIFYKNENLEEEKAPELRILNIGSGKERTLVKNYECSLIPPCWSHARKWLIYFNFPSNYPQKNAAYFYKIDTENGQKTEIFNERILSKNPNWKQFSKILDKYSPAWNLQISSDDSQIAICANDFGLNSGCTSIIWKFDMVNKSLEKIPYAFLSYSPSLSPSFLKIVSSKKEKDGFSIIFYDVKKGKYTQLVSGENNSCTPIWTWDEKQIIFIRNNNTICIMNSDGTNQRQIFPKKDAEK